MKVSVLTLEYPPYVYGGAGAHVHHLTRYLSKFLDIEIRTIKFDASAKKIEKANNIIIKRYEPWSDITNKAYENFKPVFKALSLALAINADPFEAELVHFHTWHMAIAGFFAKKLYKRKLVATIHSLEPKRPWKKNVLGEGYNLSLWIEKTGLEACDMVIAVSKFMKRDILEVYDIEEKNIRVIYNGIDEKIWKPIFDEKILKRYNIKKPYILFVGRLSKQKGILTLIKAFKDISKNVSLVLVTGRPDDEKVLAEFKYAIKNIKNIVWINRILSVDELVPLYSMAEVFACPSIYEPFGIVNLEAMATETPVVASNVGGIPEVVVDGKTGILVEPGNHQALRDTLEHLLLNPDLARKLGKEGRRHVLKKFTWKKIAKETFEIYKELVENDN